MAPSPVLQGTIIGATVTLYSVLHGTTIGAARQWHTRMCTRAQYQCKKTLHGTAHLGCLLVVLHSVKRPRLHPVWCRASTLGCLECGAELSILNCEALQFQVWKGPHTEEEYAHIN